MAKRNIVKKSTVDQIERLIKEHGVVGMMDTDEYNNMITRNFLNKLEKDNMRTIIAMVNDGKSYDEIRFVVEGGEHSQNKSDPVEEATKDFMISMSAVVLSEPPEIIIGGVDDVEEKPEEVECVKPEKVEANDNTVQEDTEIDNVVLLKDIVNEKKEDDTKRVDNENSTNDSIVEVITTLSKICEIKEAEENQHRPTWTPPKYTKRKRRPAFTLPKLTDYTKELRKFH